jgi:hypothetical protein
MIEQLILSFLQASNEVLAAGIVVLATSMLLYNLTRDLHNRIARTSGIVLACVTIPYVVDVFVAIVPDFEVLETIVRLQWLGIAFIPAALFHMSDALLATTGLPSRGRRRRIVRLLYLISLGFFVMVMTGDSILDTVRIGQVISIEAGAWAWLYITFFVSLMIVTFINVQRARQRALTRNTQRRMAYLQIAILTPALGIFPYSLLLNENDEYSLFVTLVIIVANLVVVLMLIFLSYPLSFFGSNKPDRVVKIELLHFLLRGPGTGLCVLAVFVFTSRTSRIFGIASDEFLPFAIVAVVLMWQWGIALATPYLERWLIYRDDEDEQFGRVQELTQRILTRSDLLQMAEANLAATCDYLRLPSAFIASVRKDGAIELEQSAGIAPAVERLDELKPIVANANGGGFQTWAKFQVLPLRSSQTDESAPVIGVFGIQASPELLASLEQDVLERFVVRAQQTLEDLALHAELFALLEGLLPQMSLSRARADAVEYRQSQAQASQDLRLYDREEIYEQVRAALRHYWGGPGITRSRLTEFKAVQTMINDSETPTQALRRVLEELIQSQRPNSERSMTAPEWTIYNILELRFLEGKKVREVARRMALSEADLYRKQRLAIEAVTDALLEREASLT